MITKKFCDRESLQRFKKDYSDGKFQTKVISNLLKQSKHSNAPKLIYSLQFIIADYSSKALEEYFGKYDFKFDGNREYELYVLSYDDLTIVGPAKREVVLSKNEKIDEILINKLINFEKDFS